MTLKLNNLIGFAKRGAMEAPTVLPSFVAAGAMSGNAAAITPALPAGWAENDILVLPVVTQDQVVTVSGYTEAGSSPVNNSNTRLTMFWKRATSSESAPATSDSGSFQIGQIIAIRGCVASGDPWEATNGTSAAGASATATMPTVTTLGPNRLIVAAFCFPVAADFTGFFSSWTNANLASVDERIDESRNPGGAGGALGLATGGKLLAGATGVTTTTISSSRAIAAWTGALKPA